MNGIDAAAEVLGDRARRDVPLGRFTTYGVGGPAALLLENCGPEELALARRAVAAGGVPVLVIGRGSNLLVSDRGFPGLALTLGEFFTRIHLDTEGGDTEGGDVADGGDVAGDEPGDSAERRVRAGAGLSFPLLARRTAALGLRGLEWAVGVPGSVGGAVRMNAGGHGSDVRASLTKAWLWDLAGAPEEGGVEVEAADLGLAYRHSDIRPLQVVVAAEFALAAGDPIEAEAEIASIVRWRREHQPGGSNAGSVFTNPVGHSAGQLIEEAGMRGHRRGSARVSPKHSNFVQVDVGGSAADARALIEEVREAVKNHSGIELQLENRLVGFESSPSSGG